MSRFIGVRRQIVSRRPSVYRLLHSVSICRLLHSLASRKTRLKYENKIEETSSKSIRDCDEATDNNKLLIRVRMCAGVHYFRGLKVNLC